jgi:hypothetical protein
VFFWVGVQNFQRGWNTPLWNNKTVNKVKKVCGRQKFGCLQNLSKIEISRCEKHHSEVFFWNWNWRANWNAVLVYLQVGVSKYPFDTYEQPQSKKKWKVFKYPFGIFRFNFYVGANHGFDCFVKGVYLLPSERKGLTNELFWQRLNCSVGLWRAMGVSTSRCAKQKGDLFSISTEVVAVVLDYVHILQLSRLKRVSKSFQTAVQWSLRRPRHVYLNSARWKRLADDPLYFGMVKSCRKVFSYYEHPSWEELSMVSFRFFIVVCVDVLMLNCVCVCVWGGVERGCGCGWEIPEKTQKKKTMPTTGFEPCPSDYPRTLCQLSYRYCTEASATRNTYLSLGSVFTHTQTVLHSTLLAAASPQAMCCCADVLRMGWFADVRWCVLTRWCVDN